MANYSIANKKEDAIIERPKLWRFVI